MLYIKLISIILIMLIASYTDIKYMKIPNILFFTGIILCLLYDFVFMPISYKEIIAKAVFIIALFFFGSLRLMGIGDIKLWMVITGILGIKESLLIIIIALLMFIIYGLIKDYSDNIKVVVLSITQLKNKEKVRIDNQKAYPFAPFMAIPTILVCIVEALINIL